MASLKIITSQLSVGNLKETTRLIKYQVSSELKKASLIWQYWPAKVALAFTEIKVTKAGSNVKLIPIEKKLLKFFLKDA